MITHVYFVVVRSTVSQFINLFATKLVFPGCADNGTCTRGLIRSIT